MVFGDSSIFCQFGGWHESGKKYSTWAVDRPLRRLSAATTPPQGGRENGGAAPRRPLGCDALHRNRSGSNFLIIPHFGGERKRRRPFGRTAPATNLHISPLKCQRSLLDFSCIACYNIKNLDCIWQSFFTMWPGLVGGYIISLPVSFVNGFKE